MLFLGHLGHSSNDCVLGNVKKYVLDKAVIDSGNFEKVDEDVFRSVCECCLLLQKWDYSSAKDKVSKKKNLFDIKKTINKYFVTFLYHYKFCFGLAFKNDK